MTTNPYPFEVDYRLYELDPQQCLLITGMSYWELREAATNFFGEGPAANMFAPTWDAILNLSAKSVWEWRQDYV